MDTNNATQDIAVVDAQELLFIDDSSLEFVGGGTITNTL